MRSTLLAVALLLLATRPAHAGAILYASEASVNRIDAYCLGDNGGIQPTPVFQRDLGGEAPRRVLVHPTLGNILYVAQQHRISVFQIDAAGRLALAPNGTIEVNDPRDLFVYRDMLYSSLHPGQVVGYRLAADGTPLRQYGIGETPEFETCIEGNVNFQDVDVEDPDGDSSNGALVFTSGGGDVGRVDAFQITPQGFFLDAFGIPQTCPDNDELHCGGTPSGKICTNPKNCTSKEGACQKLRNPLSFRRNLFRPKSMIFRNGLIYVEQKSLNRITSYVLQPNGFCEYFHGDKKSPPTPNDPQCNDTPIKASNTDKGQWNQPPDSKTGQIARYQSLTLIGDTIVASQFNEGRLDSYTLKPDNKLRTQPSRTGSHDPRRNYIRMMPYTTPRGGTALYVAGGIVDRVLVYGVKDNQPDSDPFSQTEEQVGAFPNDVAVAVFSGPCQ